MHHVAWASTPEEHEAWRERVDAGGRPPTPVIDRFYFKSIYFREPSGVLFEIATIGPGFTADEPLETLGERLSLPPNFEHLREQVEPALTPLPKPRDAWVEDEPSVLTAPVRPARRARRRARPLPRPGYGRERPLPLLDALDPERRLLGVTLAARSSCRRGSPLVRGPRARLPGPRDLRRLRARLDVARRPGTSRRSGR